MKLTEALSLSSNANGIICTMVYRVHALAMIGITSGWKTAAITCTISCAYFFDKKKLFSVSYCCWYFDVLIIISLFGYFFSLRLNKNLCCFGVLCTLLRILCTFSLSLYMSIPYKEMITKYVIQLFSAK